VSLLCSHLCGDGGALAAILAKAHAHELRHNDRVRLDGRRRCCTAARRCAVCSPAGAVCSARHTLFTSRSPAVECGKGRLAYIRQTGVRPDSSSFHRLFSCSKQFNKSKASLKLLSCSLETPPVGPSGCSCSPGCGPCERRDSRSSASGICTSTFSFRGVQSDAT
jgi:hypothetical protein